MMNILKNNNFFEKKSSLHLVITGFFHPLFLLPLHCGNLQEKRFLIFLKTQQVH